MKLMIVLIALHQVRMERLCLPNQDELIQVTESYSRWHSQATSLQGDFLKYHSAPQVQVSRMRVKYEKWYCLPAFEIGDPRCRKREGTLVVTGQYSNITLGGFLCPVSPICLKDCEGLTEFLCLEDSRIVGREYNGVLTLGKDISYFHHSCLHKWQCDREDLIMNTKVLSAGVVQINGPNLLSCNVSVNQNFCFNRDTGDAFFMTQGLNISVERVTLPCIRGNDETLCHDPIESEDLEVIGSEAGYTRKSFYHPIDVDIPYSKGYPVARNSPASLYDLEKVWKTLEMENLKGTYNIHLIFKRIEQMERLIYSILLYNYNTTNDPLHHYRKSESEILKYNSTHMVLRSCKTPDYVSPQQEGKMDHLDIWRKVSFTNIENVFETSYKPMDFAIDTMSRESILRVIQGSDAMESGSLESTGSFYGFLSFLNHIASFLLSAQVYITYINLILVLYIVKRSLSFGREG